jgi:hypothetical protein
MRPEDVFGPRRCSKIDAAAAVDVGVGFCMRGQSARLGRADRNRRADVDRQIRNGFGFEALTNIHEVSRASIGPPEFSIEPGQLFAMATGPADLQRSLAVTRRGCF